MSHEFNPVCVPLPPFFKDVPHSRGRKRAEGLGKYRVVYVHTYEGNSTYLPMWRFTNSVAAPAFPSPRAFQSRDYKGRLTWVSETGERTADINKARKSLSKGTVYRPPEDPLVVIKGVTPEPWCFGPAYFAFADGYTGDYIRTADPKVYTLNSQGGKPNEHGLSICIPGNAGRTREEWLNGWGRNQILGVAKYIVDCSKDPDFDIDLVKLSAKDILAGKSGYAGHGDASDAYHASNHQDPGDNFPWDYLELVIYSLLTGDDMGLFVQLDDDPAAFAIGGDGIARWIPNPETVGTWQFLKTLSSTPVKWNSAFLSTYILAGDVPAEKYPGLTKITKEYFAGHIPAN